ncbi:hypothetical protein [Chitinophaga pinensis]|uniref:Uncharacterized protein n=1 Tax=Chitinophaga pinensis (strain ATCC 43595 / DSM 2588 / LMG 13176 / NBRC 15968 / NCIMB 11800 / UQM 2034) TaxID=485918 RepID=A0A979FYP6_CHIPD|nr:hypothetical protein [Chitinophaga pinensis]ACU57568.1 hypothetical protein Cpin_0062 [Chitinophaga pinensis DSM 2588]
MMNHYTNFIKDFDALPIEDIANFFHDNAGQIDTLIQLYQAYNKRILNIQCKRIHELKQAITTITTDDQWSDMEGLELTYDQFMPNITITGGFASNATDPLHTFNIEISVPDDHSWNHYENHLISRYPGQEPIIKGDSTILHIAARPGNETTTILSTLEEVYSFLSSLTVNTFFHSLTSH